MMQADTTTPPTQTANDSAAAAAALAAEEQLRASGRQIKRVTKDLPEYQPQHKSKPKGRLSESLQVNYGLHSTGADNIKTVYWSASLQYLIGLDEIIGMQ